MKHLLFICTLLLSAINFDCFGTNSIWTKDHFKGPLYDIGDWSYGVPKVVTWGDRSHLKIGKFCALSQEIIILLDAEHRPDWATTYTFQGIWPDHVQEGHPGTKGDVVIGNDVWIGYQAMILSGVTIGDGAVIGARAVVTKDVPPYAIVVGSPARVIRYRFSPSIIERLLKIQWWNWPLERIHLILPLLTSDKVEELVSYAESIQANHPL